MKFILTFSNGITKTIIVKDVDGKDLEETLKNSLPNTQINIIFNPDYSFSFRRENLTFYEVSKEDE